MEKTAKKNKKCFEDAFYIFCKPLTDHFKFNIKN